jgi:hypothetical protein
MPEFARARNGVRSHSAVDLEYDNDAEWFPGDSDGGDGASDTSDPEYDNDPEWFLNDPDGGAGFDDGDKEDE